MNASLTHALPSVFADARSASQLGFTVSAEVQPDPAWVDAYAVQRERYRALYPALKEIS